MLKQVFRIATLLSLVIVVAACGRRLPDEYFQTTTDFADEAAESVAVAEASDDETETSDESAAETEETASETSADESVEEEPETEVVVEADVAEPQVELVEVPLDPIIEQVANANPANGLELMGSGVPCTSCHSLDSEAMLVGPGFLNIPTRAENRIEGVVAERYLYNSIIHPNDFVVDGFAQGIMPAIYADTYTESDLLDIVAYLMTLGEYPEREPQFIEVVAEPSADTETTDEAQSENSDEAVVETEETSDEDTSEMAETDSADTPEIGEIDLSGVPATVNLLAEHGSSIQGAALFDAQLVNGMSCSTCHSIDGNPSDSQSDLSEVASRDNAAAYMWAAVFNNDLHPSLGSAYQQELTNAETSHLVAYLLTFNASEDE